MVCKYLSSKNKACMVKKVDPIHGVCKKHLQLYLNKLSKHTPSIKMESNDAPKLEMEKPKKPAFNSKENEEIDELLDSDSEMENSEEDLEFDSDEEMEGSDISEKKNPEDLEKEKADKEYQLSLIKMGYNFMTNIMEKMAPENLENFSKQCSEDKNIQRSLEELSNKRTYTFLKNASPEFKIIFFTGIIAVGKVTTNSLSKQKMARMKNITQVNKKEIENNEANRIILEEYKDL